MVKIHFFPLDITYKIIDDKPVILLFGRTTDGTQICVMDESFVPYFYVIPKNEEIINRIKQIDGVINVRWVDKKYYRKDVKALKIETRFPADIRNIRNIIKEWAGVEGIYEYDIPFTRRYLIDKNIIPFMLLVLEGEFTNIRSKVPIFRIHKIEQHGDATLKNLRILAIDIETYSPDGSLLPEKYPIIMLSFYGKDFKKVITWKRFKTSLSYVEFVSSEAALIKRFKEIIEEYKPDIITGYFSEGFDLPYIHIRAKKYRIRLDVGLEYSELSVRRGETPTARIVGIAHVDIFRFISKIIGSTLGTELLTLEEVASELIKEQKKDVKVENLAKAWDKIEELESYCEYNLQDAYLAYRLCEKFLPNLIELVKIVGLPIYEINRMGLSQLVEWYLIRQTPVYNQIIPNRPSDEEIKRRQKISYKGAFVYEPHPGLFNHIVVFDYKSLYPTIIVAHNISPESLNCDCCKESAKVPNSSYWFCKKKRGFLPLVIEELITRRMRIKEIMKEGDILLDARQQSLKLLANSFYGYLGFFAARWYSIECAESVTAYGRYYIKKVIKTAQDLGFDVLYSDTDSVFISLNKKTLDDAKKFMEMVNLELPGLMELEYEGFYLRGFFVPVKEGGYGAKKKYALLTKDGTIKIRGFETVRRNWSVIAKETQRRVIEIILKDNNKGKALNYVRKVIDDLKNKRIAIEKVVITTQLQKDIGSYDSIGPHVAVAKKLHKKGVEIKPGSIIKYVIIKGNKKISERAILVDELKGKDYDPDYYINNQIIPAVEKIFNVVGYSKQDILMSKEQKKLDFFNKN